MNALLSGDTELLNLLKLEVELDKINNFLFSKK
jgi:hypothetical protein